MKPTEASDQREARDHATLADALVAFQLTIAAALENRGRGRRDHRAWLAAVPIVIVNYVAFRAQLRFWQAHLGPADAVLVSVALESMAIYLAWLAHQAMIAPDSAFRLRLAAYGMALLIGVLNYSHYMRPGWRPTVAAVTFGMMSVVSPWLWSAYSRRISRSRLKALDRIEDPAVKLGGARWSFHAYRCFRVMRAATWQGENRPAEAIKLVYPDQPGAQAERKATAPQSPPPAPRGREPRRPAAAVAVGSALPEGLEAARSEAERGLVRDLVTAGLPLPGRNELAEREHAAMAGSRSTRRRAADRILADARAGLDGHERVNGS